MSKGASRNETWQIAQDVSDVALWSRFGFSLETESKENPLDAIGYKGTSCAICRAICRAICPHHFYKAPFDTLIILADCALQANSRIAPADEVVKGRMPLYKTE